MAKATISTDLSLDTTRFQRSLAKSQSAVKRFASAATTQILRVGAAFAGIGLIKNIVRLGTASAETASKFNAVFGPAAEGIDRKIKELKKTIPATVQEMRNSTATIGQMARSFGLSEDAANDLSVEMVKITGDLASFNNMKFEEAFLKIRSAISGEYESLKQFGIVINEARLKQEGLNTGVWDGTGALSAAQKALIVHSILIQDMGEAHGDAAATADSAANKMKFLKTQLEEAATEIGETSLPAILELVKALASVIKFADDGAKAVGRFAGELTFGKEATLKERSMRGLAKNQLINEGVISKEEPGGFMGAILNRNERNRRTQLIEERTQLLLKEQATEETKKETEANEELTGEIEGQVDAETDPARKKALEERLSFYEKLIKKAGELNSVISQGRSNGKTKAERELEKLFEKGDKNRDGIITGREKRAKEREERKKETEMRRKRTAAIAAESMAFQNQKEVETSRRMTAREQASGLFNTMSQRTGQMQNPKGIIDSAASGGMKGKKDDKNQQLNDAVSKLESIDQRLSKLDNALSGG